MRTLFLVIATFCTIQGFCQSSIKEGLIAYYPFDGNAKDESGNNHNGLVQGATLCADRYGRKNKAYEFNGINDFIDIGNSLLNQNSSFFTIGLWFKTNYSGHINTLLSSRHTESLFSHTLVIENDKTELSLDGPRYFKLFKSNTNVNDNKWHFIAITKNKYQYNLYLY